MEVQTRFKQMENLTSVNKLIYGFEVPTRMTKLEPVFTFAFDLNNREKSNCFFNVALNPKFTERNGDMTRTYYFDSEGTYQFIHEEFENFFIDGEIKLLESQSEQTERRCFVSITYGSKDEALHFIKGRFQLIEKN